MIEQQVLIDGGIADGPTQGWASMKKWGRRAWTGVMLPRYNLVQGIVFKAHEAQNPVFQAGRANQVVEAEVKYCVALAKQAFWRFHSGLLPSHHSSANELAMQ